MPTKGLPLILFLCVNRSKICRSKDLRLQTCPTLSLHPAKLSPCPQHEYFRRQPADPADARQHLKRVAQPGWSLSRRQQRYRTWQPARGNMSKLTFGGCTDLESHSCIIRHCTEIIALCASIWTNHKGHYVLRYGCPTGRLVCCYVWRNVAPK